MKYLILLLSVLSFNIFADIPSLGSTGSGSEVRTAAGASCKEGTQRTIVDAGVMSRSYTDDNDVTQIQNPYYNSFNQPQSKGTVYLRITIPLGAKKNRIDCRRMYNLELTRMQSENEILRKQIEELKNSAVILTVQ